MGHEQGLQFRQAVAPLMRLPDLAAARRQASAAERNDALAMAMRLYRSPGMARHIRISPLPTDVLRVIRIAAGCPDSLDGAIAQTGLDQPTIRRVASLYLLVALFNQGADSRRALGVGPDALPAEVQDHKKWLLKWLHPDRNDNQAVAKLSVRVLAASAELAATALRAPPAPEPQPDPAAPVRRRPVLRHRWIPMPLGA